MKKVEAENMEAEMQRELVHADKIDASQKAAAAAEI